MLGGEATHLSPISWCDVLGMLVLDPMYHCVGLSLPNISLPDPLVSFLLGSNLGTWCVISFLPWTLDHPFALFNTQSSILSNWV